MDNLVTAALAGTGKMPQIPALPADSAGALAATVAPDRAEDRLLLAAGAEAVYRMAGQLPVRLPEAHDPAPPEERPECPPRTAKLLRGMLQGDLLEVLPDVLARLEQARLRIPSELLPAALAVTDSALRAALVPVMGRRGEWLSRFNPDWAWMREAAPSQEAADDEALQQAWEEGDITLRLRVFEQMRRRDPERARSWLEQAWKAEKSEYRVRLLKAMDVGLSTADEAFLESHRADRSAAVREEVFHLLAGLPESDYAIRMRERAESLLQAEQEGWLRKRPRLRCEPPDRLDEAWSADIVNRPPVGMGYRAWWVAQTLRAVPPAHWEQRFGASPTELVAAAEADDFGGSVIEGWTHAALRRPEAAPGWPAALWPFWSRIYAKLPNGGVFPLAVDFVTRLLAAMPPESAEALLLPCIEASVRKDAAAYAGFAESLPSWSPGFTRAYLRALREGFESTLKQNSFTWARHLPVAARRIPPVCFDTALEPWTVSDGTPWQGVCQREIGRMVETLGARRIVYEEIPVEPR